MKRKLLLAMLCIVSALSFKANAQASYNRSWTSGSSVAVGTDFFLYNIGAGQFLTGGMDWGSHASADHAGKVVTLAAHEDNDGGYTIYTAYYSANGVDNSGYLTNGNPYTDNDGESGKANWKFTPVDVAGYTNAYTIKNDDNFLYYNSADTRVNLGSSTGDNYSYWLIIPKSARDAVGDYTYYLQNVGINRFWERACWAGCTWGNDKFSTGGNADNPCGEKYHGALDFYQTITKGVPVGRYRLNAQGFWRQDGSAAGPMLYANSDTKPLSLRTGSENNMNAASTSFTNGNYVNFVETFVSSEAAENLRVGINITDGSQWVIFDNFTLDYLGQCVMDYAEELPDGGAMTADKWYYFDIAVAGDNYNATADDLSKIICTDDGYTLTSAESGDVTLTATDNTLAVKRYYVKSISEANNLVVAPAAYTYVVGDATQSIADGAYINNTLSVITFNFSEAVTSDPSASFAILDNEAKASLKKGGVEQAKGTLSLEGTVLTATFNTTLDLSSTYTIDIAAGVVGYAGHETNTAINTTLKTGAITDGVYYFKKNGEDKYITRGGWYGTEAVVDNFGLSFEAIIQTDGKYALKNVDHSLSANTNKYLRCDGSTYTDQGLFGWIIEATEGGYYLRPSDTEYMTTTNNAEYGFNYMSKTEVVGDAYVWTLLTKAQYADALVATKNAEISAIAAAAGISASSVAELETVLASDFGSTDKTSSISGAALKTAEDMAEWTQVKYNGVRFKDADANGVCGEIWNSTGGVKQNIPSLPEGIYKVTVYATWRPGNQAAGNRAGSEANTTAWMYANAGSSANITQLVRWYDGDPNVSSRSSFVETCEAHDTYLNTTYVYVGEGETLTVGLASPSFCEEPWFPFYGFTLTYYEAKATPAEKAALAAAIEAAEANTLGFENGEYAPYNNVDALTKLAAAKAIDPATASGASVVAATTALTGATWTANVGEQNAVYDGDFAIQPEHTTSPTALAGWNNPEGLRQLIKNAETDPGLAYASQGAGFFAWGNTSLSYGAATGYTMPLAAHTVYELNFKTAGWRDGDMGYVRASVLNSSSEGLSNTNSPTATKRINNTSENPWVEFNATFETGEAGDYTLSMWTSKHAVITDITLYKVPAQSVTISAAGFATLYNAYALDFEHATPAGLKAYTASLTDETVTLTEVQNVPAETGVVLKGAAGTYSIPVLASSSTEKGDLTGSTTESTAWNAYLGEGYYIYGLALNGEGKAQFKKITSDSVAAGKAFLKVPTALGSKAFPVVDGTATEVTAPEVAENEEEEVLVNLAGIPVGKDYKGIVINQKGEKKLQK